VGRLRYTWTRPLLRDTVRMAILTYHAVNPGWQSPLSVAPDRFEHHCSWLSRRHRVVPVAEAAERFVSSGKLPSRIVSITFDDGYEDLFDHALPALARHDLAATVFLVSATLTDNQSVDWVDSPPGEPLRTLRVEQVLEMQEAGVSFGSHSRIHHDLTELSDDECERDLRDSKQALEDLLGRQVSLLAYPRGLHDERVRGAAKRAGFSYAFGSSKRMGPVGRFSIPRVGVYGDDGVPWLALKTLAAYPRLKRLLGRS
jgi:peptidoglycan/xylan/chitin deacetylase (PgdA/CDA1 family)